MHIVRHNAESEISGAPPWFLRYLGRVLSVPVEPGTKAGVRFGAIWWHQGECYGTMLQGSRIPAGLTRYAVHLAEQYGLLCHVTDAREQPEDQIPWWSVSMKWRPYQERVHKGIVRAATGVIDAPPRSGKTAMAARLIDTLAHPTIYVAPSVQIVRQTYDRFVRFWGHDFVSRIDGSARDDQKDPSKPIVVTTPQSALALDEAWWATRKVLIIDEFHHSAAETYHKVSLAATSAYYRYGFTGTHFRTGDDRLAMDAIASQVIASISLEELVPEYLAYPQVKFIRVKAPGVSAADWRVAYRQGIVESPERNDIVVQLANTLLENRIPTIVLVRRRKHADELAERIHGAVAVKGGENALTSRAVLDFTEGAHQCLVGTTVIGEGVDVPRAAALIYASGGSDGVAMAQSYFRPLTAYKGKTVGHIYDFVDQHHRTLRRHSGNRISMAKRLFGEGCVIVGD